MFTESYFLASWNSMDITLWFYFKHLRFFYCKKFFLLRKMWSNCLCYVYLTTTSRNNLILLKNGIPSFIQVYRKRSWAWKCARSNLNRKDLSFCHKFWFSNLYIFAVWCCRPLIFQTLNSVRLNSLSLKYKRFTPSSCKDRVISKFELVAKTQFLGINVFEK